MNLAIERLSRFYALLTILYPHDFRQDFAREMQAVFNEKLLETSERGAWALWRDFWKELHSLPMSVLTEYWSAFRNTFGRGIMSLITEDKSWKIENCRDAIIASLPPVLFGLGITIGALVIWEPWYAVPEWRLWAGVIIGLIPALVIAMGGLFALIKRIPSWGYTWVGASAMGLLLFVKTLAEERADDGLPLISPRLDFLVMILFLLGFAVLLMVAAWQGWRHAGMVSLGFATMTGISIFSMATAAPLNRYDLAIMAAPVGLLMSLLAYLYVRKGGLGRLFAILGFGSLNTFMFLIVANAWEIPSVHAFPVVPFLVVLTGALLVGPLVGLLGKPVRRVIRGS